MVRYFVFYGQLKCPSNFRHHSDSDNMYGLLNSLQTCVYDLSFVGVYVNVWPTRLYSSVGWVHGTNTH